jgi:hypothetical protein
MSTQNITTQDSASLIREKLINKVGSDISAVTGSTQVTNMIALTQAQYDGITPDAATVYLITGD